MLLPLAGMDVGFAVTVDVAVEPAAGCTTSELDVAEARLPL